MDQITEHLSACHSFLYNYATDFSKAVPPSRHRHPLEPHERPAPLNPPRHPLEPHKHPASLNPPLHPTWNADILQHPGHPSSKTHIMQCQNNT